MILIDPWRSLNPRCRHLGEQKIAVLRFGVKGFKHASQIILG